MKHEGEEMISARNSAGTTREFTATQWRNMGKDKAGWKPVAPDEVDTTAQALQAARERYKFITGKDAPTDKSADYVTAMSDMLQGHNAAVTPASTPASGTAYTIGGAVAPTQATRNASGFNRAEGLQSDPAAIATSGLEHGGVTKENYSKPGSLEDARSLFALVTGSEAGSEATQEDLTANVEQLLGIAPGGDTSNDPTASGDAGAPLRALVPSDNTAKPDGSTTGGITAENYKRPRSTEEARELYAVVQRVEAQDGAKFGDMVAEIEHTLGVPAK